MEQEMILKYQEFRNKILTKPNELERISKELTRIENSDLINRELNFFRDHFFIPKYGEKAYQFLMDILDNKLTALENQITEKDFYYDLRLFESKHNYLITKAYNQIANPMGFLQLNNVFDNQGRFVIELVRTDGKSVKVNLNYEQKLDIAIGLINQTVGELNQFGHQISPEKYKVVVKQLEAMLESVKRHEPKQ